MFSNKLKTLNKFFNLHRTKVFRLIDDNQIENVINYFKPTLTNYKLIRIGENNDGGYLIPDILNEIKYCFSAGVGHTNKFESDLKRFEVKSFLADKVNNISKSWIFIGSERTFKKLVKELKIHNHPKPVVD